MKPVDLRIPGFDRKIREFLDRKLAVDPENDAKILQGTSYDQEQLNARHRREYAAATQEFIDDDPRVVAAWMQRVKSQTSWLSSPEYQKAKKNSLVASFVGIFVSNVGAYPKKLSMLGVDFDSASRSGLCLALIMLIWYLWAAANMLLRDTLVEEALLEIQHKKDRVYKTYSNRWVMYIIGNYAEKVAFQRRMTTLIAIYACLSLSISLLRNIFHQ